jgi:hypothetical protein
MKGNNMQSPQTLASTHEDDGTLSVSFRDTFIVPDDCLPTGYDTLPSFTMKHMPLALDLMADPIGGWVEEEADLVKLCATYGAPMRHVRAAPAFRKHGILQQRAFQIGMLAMLFR